MEGRSRGRSRGDGGIPGYLCHPVKRQLDSDEGRIRDSSCVEQREVVVVKRWGMTMMVHVIATARRFPSLAGDFHRRSGRPVANHVSSVAGGSDKPSGGSP